MKIVTGLFQPNDAITVVRRLIDNDFNREDLSMMSTIEQVPTYLEDVEPEEAAVSGATVGAVTGGSLGALGSWVASTIPGFESTIFVTGLMATTVGGVVGGYLGSLYNIRADDQTKIDIHEELAAGKILLVVRMNEETEVETAVSLMEQSNGEHVEIHEISDEEIEESEQSAK